MPGINLILGDCYEKLKDISDDSIDLIIIDPPYITTKEKWDQKDIITEELSKEFYRVLRDTGNFYCWCGIGEKSQSLIRWFPIFLKNFIFKDLITWKKQRGIGMRKGWLYAREEIMWFVKDNGKFIWNKKNQCGKEKRQKYGFKTKCNSEYKRFTNVWGDIREISLTGIFGKQKPKDISLHFTPKPIEAIERLIEVHTNENDLVLDPMMGSGTTGVVCNELKRNFIGIEINPEYFELAKKRINNTLFL
jgi:site-specific DNA-methyltransferase (adenine-specific)